MAEPVITKALAKTNGKAAPVPGLAFGELSVQDIVDRKRKIVEVMRAVMKEGEHYGVIPGTQKPTLFKAGAEIIALTFGLAPRFKIERIDYDTGHREYIVTCELVHIASGRFVGEGVGSCSTMEAKYRWRRGERRCPECDAPTIRKSKPEYGGGWYCNARADGCGAKFAKGDPAIENQDPNRQENQDISDCFNTVLKMAKKRAQIDATLTATGASDVLTQDLEDLPPSSEQIDAWESDDVIEPEWTDAPQGQPPQNHREQRRAPQSPQHPNAPQAQQRQQQPQTQQRQAAPQVRENDPNGPIARILATRSEAECRALIPDLSKLDGATAKAARAAYGQHMAALRKGAAAGGAR